MSSKHGFKGPWFPSYENAKLDDKPRMVRAYDRNTRSLTRALRDMRQKTRHLLDSKDPAIVQVGRAVVAKVKDEPHPEYSTLHLFCAGLEMQRETGAPWVECMLVILDKFDEIEKGVELEAPPVEEVTDAAAESQPKTISRIGRLLRAITPRAFRSRDEGSAEGSADQHAGTGDRGESTDGARSGE